MAEQKEIIPAAAIKAYGALFFKNYVPVRVKGMTEIGWCDNQVRNIPDYKPCFYVLFFGIKEKDKTYPGGIKYHGGLYHTDNIEYLDGSKIIIPNHKTNKKNECMLIGFRPGVEYGTEVLIGTRDEVLAYKKILESDNTIKKIEIRDIV